MDHRPGQVWASVLGRRQADVWLALPTLREPGGSTRSHPDYWGAYTRHLPPDVYRPGTRTTPPLERQHLPLRTRIQRLPRKTLGCSTSIERHDIGVGCCCKRFECRLLVGG